MSDHILVSRADGVCEVQLNRPDKRNALTLAMYGALIDALNEARADESIRVVLLSGAGVSFTAGNDLNDFLSQGVPGGDSADSSANFSDSSNAVRFLETLRGFRKVLVAAVHGQTVGIGVTTLLHCDLVVAARSTQMSMPFVKLGLVPEAGSSLLLPRLVGYQRAAELLLLGRPFDAAEALQMGLVNRVTEDASLMDEARRLARTIAQQPPGALLAAKRLLRSETGLGARMQEELEAFRVQLGSEEFKAAVQAFFAKARGA
ncbi:MAG TPA: enoyl-CoA hydratase [Steroidobacteraceae bacterium]